MYKLIIQLIKIKEMEKRDKYFKQVRLKNMGHGHAFYFTRFFLEQMIKLAFDELST